jgi:hypothetical protein
MIALEGIENHLAVRVHLLTANGAMVLDFHLVAQECLRLIDLRWAEETTYASPWGSVGRSPMATPTPNG